MQQNNSSDMSNNIEIIREWIQNEAAFGRTDKLFITIFLEACENDVEKTKQRIVRYYELRRLYPGLMTNRDCLDEKHVKLLRQKVIYADMNDNCELPAVLTIKLSRLEIDDNMHDAIRGFISATETSLLHWARLRKHGGIIIVDFENVELTHVLQMTPSLTMQTFKCFYEALPVKCSGLIAINVGFILRAIINVGSLILPAEMHNIMTMSSGSWDSIHDKVPPQCLPIEYGGTNGTMDENLELIEAISMRWRDYLLDDERYGFNDSEVES